MSRLFHPVVRVPFPCRSLRPALAWWAVVALCSCAAAAPDAAASNASFRVETANLGVLGTGSKFFRCALSHSSGVVYIGTYGPEPARLWKYLPATGELKMIAEPGEYQLDSMVEAPNGVVYIGTAYSALVYRLDPATDQVTSLGSPPIDSTTWIFTMVRTRAGEIYGAKGVGLFRLDWQTDTLEAIGVVPGDHTTLGPNASMPITRQLEEDADGVLWGDTNRWLFRFDPKTKRIEPLVDMAQVDKACYALFLPSQLAPVKDIYFALYARFGGGEVGSPFYAYRRSAGAVEPVPIAGIEGRIAAMPAWWVSDAGPRLLACEWRDEQASLVVADPEAGRVVARWRVESTSPASPIPGPGFYFFSATELLQAEPSGRILRALAHNPTPAQSRCLAISRDRVLGTDTYDCGHAFTLDLKTMERADHGKVWFDDHRCNYGPAAFAGADGRYFIANHSQQMQSLWVTDTHTHRHCRIGEAASQLVAFSDGTVWGVFGPNPNTLTFDGASWRSRFQSLPGKAFRYTPGAGEAAVLEPLGETGPLVEAPDGSGRALAARGLEVRLYDAARGAVVARVALDSNVAAAASDMRRGAAWLLDAEGVLYRCTVKPDGQLGVAQAAPAFGPAARGFFVLPRSGRVTGIGEDGAVTCFDPAAAAVLTAQGPPPLPAGPAVDPEEDAWYYADEHVMRYTPAPSPQETK